MNSLHERVLSIQDECHLLPKMALWLTSTIRSLFLSRNKWTVHVKWLPVSTSHCIIGLWIQQKASRYGGYSQIQWISSHGQTTTQWSSSLVSGEGTNHIHQHVKEYYTEPPIWNLWKWQSSKKYIRWVCLEWIRLTQYGDKWQAIVNLIKKFRNP